MCFFLHFFCLFVFHNIHIPRPHKPMDRNEVSLTLVSVRIVLRPLYISKANLFWSLIKISLHSLAAYACSRTITSCKAALNWISNLFLVRCGENGLFLHPVSQFVSKFFTKLSLSLLVLHLFLCWSEASQQFLKAFQDGERRKKDKYHDIFFIHFFSSHYFLLVLSTK